MMAQVQCDCGESVLNLIVDTKEITILHCTTWDTYTYSFLCPIQSSIEFQYGAFEYPALEWG